MRLPIILLVLPLVACDGSSDDGDSTTGAGDPSPGPDLSTGTDAPSGDDPVAGPVDASGGDTDEGDVQTGGEPGPEPGSGEDGDGDSDASEAGTGDPGTEVGDGMPGTEGDGPSEQESGDTGSGGNEPRLDVIDRSNYVSLVEFAVQMNIVILTDRAFSPTLFLERFPGTVESAARAGFDEAVRAIGPGTECAMGGAYETSLRSDVGNTFANLAVSYADCATASGTLDGAYVIDTFFGGSVVEEEYDLTYTQESGADGAGTTVVDARFNIDRVGARSFEVDDYSRNTERNAFAVSGSGGRGISSVVEGDRFVEGDDVAFEYNAETAIAVMDEFGPIELEITLDGLVVNDLGLYRGALTLVAQDGSRVEAGAGDTPQTIALTVTDPDGEPFTDTVAWSEIYRPPDRDTTRR